MLLQNRRNEKPFKMPAGGQLKKSILNNPS